LQAARLEEAGSLALNSSLRPVFAPLVRGYLAAYHRLEIVGRERLPHGPFVMVSNHSSHLDAVCLRAALPLGRLRTSFTAVAEEYFAANSFRRMSAKLLANAIPFSRHVRTRGGMRECISILRGGDAVLVFFPEGTRSRDGQLGIFRPGIGALLAGTKLQVVPCAIQGSFGAWPKGQRFAWPGRVRLVIGDARQYDGLPRNRQSHHEVANDLRSAVGALLCS
jgi:1-acyl-sn-glycerol-3-phosphate acyltransferase/long-chain acyl-CoA synthetase